ncbi:hypothetical protein [Labrenzia sp. PHM005]|uniref:GAP1-N1 domain-containing protein n=1 Tax=Labrenzia sp. PHM005 TaxID=2590016 RepID=UPI00210FF1C2|nr:hypothetical protein [Labrenzia sp. PHM005]
MTPTIHQALHGYNDGHRLLSSSMQISGQEARIMLVMSDLSGPGVKPEDSGYLTGYPLETLGKYVLARTWAAPEMSRPGCVWTHSLIIDNADLAAFSSAEGLLSAFCRPTGLSSKSTYANTIDVPVTRTHSVALPDHRAQSIVNALYTIPDQIVLTETEAADDDELLVSSIWMQQWPRLRRTFGFCTLSGIDRSSKGVKLDLQFVRTMDRQNLAKFPDAVTATGKNFNVALKPLLADIAGKKGYQFREFLKRAGGDVDGGRRAMLPLCRLYSSLFGNADPDLRSAVDALDALAIFGNHQARLVRALIVRSATENIEDVENEVFDFVVDSLDLVAQANEKMLPIERIAQALWLRSPKRFMKEIQIGGAIGLASQQALETMEASKLIVGLRENVKFAEYIVELRPELLERPDFWEISGVDETLAIGAKPDSAGRVVAALLAADRAGITVQLIGRANSDELASAFEEHSNSSALSTWLAALASFPNKAAEVLASGRICNKAVVVGLARASEPDSVPNEFGEDPWVIASRYSGTSVSQPDEDYFSAFLMSRALGDRSLSQANLIQISYTTLYRALQFSRLPWEVERLAKWRLDSGSWFSWDSCSRLRETVVKRFVKNDLDPEIFGKLTDDENLARALINEAAETGSGRRYLREVRKRLKSTHDGKLNSRVDYIASKIK